MLLFALLVRREWLVMKEYDPVRPAFRGLND